MALIYHPSPIELPIEPFLKRYGEGRRRRKMEPVYRAMLDAAAALCKPVVLHEEFSVTAVPELADTVSADTKSVVLAICTLGADTETEVRALIEDEPAQAFVLDEIALAWIVALTRDVHRSIREQKQAQGLRLGAAYRPGLGKWPLSLQETIFQLLPAADIDVILNEQLVMIPKMSTSLIMPVRGRN